MCVGGVLLFSKKGAISLIASMYFLLKHHTCSNCWVVSNSSSNIFLLLTLNESPPLTFAKPAVKLSGKP